MLIFTMRTVHAGTDNEIDPLRLSTDTRYQPANQPIDDRWIGEAPDRPRPRGQAGPDLLSYDAPAASPLCQNRCSSTNARIIGTIAISEPTIAS